MRTSITKDQYNGDLYENVNHHVCTLDISLKYFTCKQIVQHNTQWKSTMQYKPYEKPGLEPMGMDGRNGMHTKDMSNGMPRVMGMKKTKKRCILSHNLTQLLKRN